MMDMLHDGREKRNEIQTVKSVKKPKRNSTSRCTGTCSGSVSLF